MSDQSQPSLAMYDRCACGRCIDLIISDAIERFLIENIRRVQLTIDEETSCLMVSPSHALRAQHRYHVHQRSTMRWLLSINQVSRKGMKHA